MSCDDGLLVELARAGDLDAYSRLVRAHQHSALRVAYAVAPGHAEDVVQEAFVKAFKASSRFESGADFRPWLLRIVTNEARNHLRRDGRQARLALRDASRRPTNGWDTPEDWAVAEDDRRRLAEAVGALAASDREVIGLRWFAGLTEAEMAIVLKCRPGTVKSRLSRAMSRLRASMPTEPVR